MPRLPVYIAPLADDTAPVEVEPVLDTGADCTAFDGSLAAALGWRTEDIASRAEDVRPIYGLGARGQPLTGYLHRLRFLIPVGRRYADFTMSVLLTEPRTLATPVLGRRDFFRLVDFALVEIEQRFYLRFRDRSALRDHW